MREVRPSVPKLNLNFRFEQPKDDTTRDLQSEMEGAVHSIKNAISLMKTDGSITLNENSDNYLKELDFRLQDIQRVFEQVLEKAKKNDRINTEMGRQYDNTDRL